MAGSAAQQAQPARKAGPGAARETRVEPEKKVTPRERLHRLPVAAGAAIMALLLVLSLFVGNFRALQNATPKAFLRQGDVQSIVEDRADAAQNVLTVARRAGLSADAVALVQQALGDLEQAKTARDISRADQALTAAVSELTTASLGGEDARSMQRAADTFAEQGSFQRQEARAYNEKAKKAERLYERLPTRALLPAPDMYEGI